MVGQRLLSSVHLLQCLSFQLAKNTTGAWKQSVNSFLCFTTCLLQYNSPGEELDPDALVAVTDDDDLEV
jgi:hypothetical protein